jgi:hypothetical protein
MPITTVTEFLAALVNPTSAARQKWEAGDRDGAMAGTGLSNDLKNMIKRGTLSELRTQCAAEKGGAVEVFFWIK